MKAQFLNNKKKRKAVENFIVHSAVPSVLCSGLFRKNAMVFFNDSFIGFKQLMSNHPFVGVLFTVVGECSLSGTGIRIDFQLCPT